MLIHLFSLICLTNEAETLAKLKLNYISDRKRPRKRCPLSRKKVSPSVNPDNSQINKNSSLARRTAHHPRTKRCSFSAAISVAFPSHDLPGGGPHPHGLAPRPPNGQQRGAQRAPWGAHDALNQERQQEAHVVQAAAAGGEHGQIGRAESPPDARCLEKSDVRQLGAEVGAARAAPLGGRLPRPQAWRGAGAGLAVRGRRDDSQGIGQYSGFCPKWGWGYLWDVL